VDSIAEADVMAIYAYDVGQATTHAVYPRSFEIALIDVKNSPDPKKPEIVWQAELHSSGSI
jgi:hypothetical protein